MTFLNPLVLFGLAAAAIPVILHLLNLRKLRTIEFSTLTFLKELQQTKIRRLKLRQLLLLIVRTLLIIFIILSFARPALRGTILGTIGTNAHSTVIFILDDSFSMTASDEHGELFKQAKESASKLIDVLKEGDEAFLIKLSDLPQATVAPATHDFTQLKNITTESHISTVRRSMEDALRLSAKLLSTSNNANKEVYIISDGQRTLFPQNLNQSGQNIGNLFGEDVKFFTIQTGIKEAVNVAIDSVEVKSTIIEQGKPVSVVASVRNYGNVPLTNYIASIFLDGVRVAQQNTNVNAWSSASLEFSVIPKKTGYIKGYIDLENDIIEQDNRRYFTLFVPEQINVALVSNSSADSKFLFLALQSGNNDSGKSILNIEQLTAQKFPFLDLQRTDVLLLSNIISFSQNDADRIRQFVERGGGLILLPGSGIQPANYNSTVLKTLNIPAIEGMSGTTSVSAGLHFQKIDYDHPLFSTVFDNVQQDKRKDSRAIESPDIAIALKRQTGKQARTIISLNDNTPFLSEHMFGSGTILFYSVAPTMQWSDLPLKGVFVPMMYRSVIYVSSHHNEEPSAITGDETSVALHNNAQRAGGKPLTLLYPDGTEEILKTSGQFETKITIPHIPLPGWYDVKSDNTTLTVVSVNTDSRESDLRKISRDDLTMFWKEMNIQPTAVQSLEPGSNLQAAIQQSRFGVELWKYCIGLALLLALLEMFIARDSRKAYQQSVEGVTVN